MKEITDEQILAEAALYRINQDDSVAYYAFIQGAKWMREELKPSWAPITHYPIDSAPMVSRWHKIWKCLVTVQHRRAYAENGCEWLSGTKDNTWPEEAFEPYYMTLPEPPTA